jgi:hypothetical protein
MPMVSHITKVNQEKCRQVLDRCEAICTFRELSGLDPIPPRYFPNLYENTMDIIEKPDTDVYGIGDFYSKEVDDEF